MISPKHVLHKKLWINPFSKLGFLHILNDGFLASFLLLLPFIQKDLNIPFSRIGLLSSFLNIAGVLLALPAAFISKRFGGFRVLILSVFIYSIAFFITGFSLGFFTLTFAFILASIGFGMFHPISLALVAKNSSSKEIGRNMGNFTAIGDIGRIGISAFVTILATLVNWRNTSFIYASFPIILFLFSFIFCRKLDFTFVNEINNKEKIHGLHNSIEYTIVLLTSFIDGLASSSLFIFLPFLLLNRGASTVLLGSLSAAFFIGNMLGKIVIGKLTDIFGCKKIFIISELSMVILLIVISIVSNLISVVLLSILLGTVTKGTVPVINALLAKSVPDRRLHEKAFGIVSLISGIAAVIAPVLFGFVAQKVNINAVFQLCAVFALLAIIPITIGKLSNIERKTI